MNDNRQGKLYTTLLNRNKVLYFINLIAFITVFILAIMNYKLGYREKILPLLIVFGLSCINFLLLMRKMEKLVTVLLLLGALSNIIINMIRVDGIADSGIIGIPIILFISILVLGRKSIIIVSVFIIAALNTIGILEINGILGIKNPATVDRLLGYDIMLVIGSMMAYVIINQIERQRKTISFQNEKLEKSLEEKEFLLKEVNHRIKNNLNILNGLLSLYSRKLHDPRDSEVFATCQKQIHTISLLHEKLYTTGEFRKIDLNEFLLNMIEYHKKICSDQGRKVVFELNTNKVTMDTKQTITLALLLNELLTNSVKHAFKKNSEGKINMNITQLGEDFISCIYSDSGKGYRKSTADQEHLGLSLISALTLQLKGEVEIRHDNEFCFRIIIPVNRRDPD